jgi:hypothetical protein
VHEVRQHQSCIVLAGVVFRQCCAVSALQDAQISFARIAASPSARLFSRARGIGVR